MNIDQDFVKENIQDFMIVFKRIHRGQLTTSNKSYHKKRMLENCDTITYRPIYHNISKHCEGFSLSKSSAQTNPFARYFLNPQTIQIV